MLGIRKIGRWPDFEGNPVMTYSREDGRRYALLGDDVVDSPNELPTSFLRRTRIGYQLFGGKAVLLGLLVSNSNRGEGQGERLIEYFLKHVGEMEAEFGGTSRIHKPVIALQLDRVGLTPDKQDYRALLLPRSNYDESPYIPKITVLEDKALDRTRVVQRAGGNTFYEEIHPTDAKFRYPFGGHEVFLHTEFTDTDEKAT